MRDSTPERDGWPAILGIVRGLQELKGSFPSLKELSDQCLRGVPEDDCLFISYTAECTQTPNPRFKEELAAFKEGLKTNPMPATRADILRPKEIIESFGENGIYFSIRIDRRDGRSYFSMVPMWEFGDSQISMVRFDGPTDEKLDAMRMAIFKVIAEEIQRFEKHPG